MIKSAAPGLKGLLPLAGVMLVALTLTNVTSLAQSPPKVPETLRLNFPVLHLGAGQSAGRTAVDRLGIHLPDVAAWYGRSASQLRQQLLADPKLRIDESGRLLVVEELERPVRAEQPREQLPGVQDGALVDLAQTFALHSRPGSRRTIYLDFNGATIAGTAWNQNGKALVASPFDIDRKPSSFSTAELMRIQYIWQRVAEDYAPFDVDVTTEAPSQDRLTRANVNDEVFGTTVVVTKLRGFMSCGCGGIAYVGVFNYSGGTVPPDYYKPAFVFYDMLSGGDEKTVAEAISHEAGHNMGLFHDGTSLDPYYGGHGSDPVVGWAPIMGVGYYKPLVQFSRGEYADASNREDDFVVAQTFGLPLRLDDHGNSAPSATPFAHTQTDGIAAGSIDGVIETPGDRDVFAISAGRGPLDISIAPASRSANLDIALSLRDAHGTALLAANPPTTLGAILSYRIENEGVYYLEVRGTGHGDPAGTGYSSYGSRGIYRVSATYTTPAGTAPIAVLTATPGGGAAPLLVSLDGGSSRDDGRVVAWIWDFGDGSGDRTGTLSSARHTYTVPGEYPVRLTVVDDVGLSSSTSEVIRVARPGPQVSVLNVQLALKSKANGSAWAVGTVSVVDQDGQPLPRATVKLSWGGVVSKSVNARTGKSGTATLNSPATKVAGCFNLTVTDVSLAGYTFNAASPRTAQVCR